MKEATEAALMEHGSSGSGGLNGLNGANPPNLPNPQSIQTSDIVDFLFFGENCMTVGNGHLNNR
jgi:hypothetical protein